MSVKPSQKDMRQKAGIARIKKPRQGWHRADIKAALEKEGWSLSALSTAHGFNRGAATRALAQSYPGLERIIADALGVEPWDIWPDRYNDYGQPVQDGNPNMVKLSRGGRPRNVDLKVVK